MYQEKDSTVEEMRARLRSQAFRKIEVIDEEMLVQAAILRKTRDFITKLTLSRAEAKESLSNLN